MSSESAARAWACVNLEAIAHNLDIARQALPDTELMPVVKAGAYGHGLEPVARRLDNHGISFFGVANVGEARRLQRAGVRTTPFILGPTFPEEREEIVQNGWCCTISTVEEAAHFQSLAALYEKEIALHVAVDTGMGREGFLPSQLAEAAAQVKTMPNLRIEGIMSHFPAADEDVPFTQDEIGIFTDCAQTLQQHFDLRYRHIAASAGELGYEVPVANLARPGLLLYGVAPMASIYDGVLRPTLSLHARVTLVRELPAGHGVSYGRTITNTDSFNLQDNLYRFNPNVYHILEFDRLMKMGRDFIELTTDTPQIFYIWGHAYEMDYAPDYWIKLEEFFELISKRDDIFYGTNAEVLL